MRLVYLEAANNNGAAAELKLHQADVPADIEGLTAVITEAKQSRMKDLQKNHGMRFRTRLQRQKNWRLRKMQMRMMWKS